MVQPRCAADRQVLGLLRAAGLELAVPLMALREVVPCPDVLDPLAGRAPGLLGAMTLRRVVVPVVSLAVAAGRHLALQADQVVVVLARDGRVVGLLVDEVKGRVEHAPAVTLDAQGGLALLERVLLHTAVAVPEQRRSDDLARAS